MRIGLISMERVPQIGLLLVFSPAAAAAICATASFIWPLFNRAYSQGSTTFAALRALHNAAMTIIMLLAAGAAYTAAGGTIPSRTSVLQISGRSRRWRSSRSS